MLKILVIVILLTPICIYSQIDTTLKEFYPLKVGNLWQWKQYEFWGSYLITCRITGDTTYSNGKHYFIGCDDVRIDSFMRIEFYRPYLGDTCGGVDQELNIYRLNEPVGAIWKLCEDIAITLCQAWFMRFDGIFTATIFGQPRQVMRFTPGAYCSNAGDTVWLNVDWLLVRGIGVYREQTIEYKYRELTGAIIDGVQYGTVVDVIDSPVEIPSSFLLKQNYPNPFNPSTVIEYSLPEAAYVVLKVYNILGEEVGTLVNEIQEAGYKAVRFSAVGGSASGGDASNLPSGVYICRLSANGSIGSTFTDVKRMIILK
ncbi:MAG: T9SS type A sorting domain-containing protein [Ignavibacteriales bacterium]|nr:T9SS type A sorting domain-containing protein [Ignavibacteriales bacterium]